MAPQVSIVIPTYNRAADLTRALRSVREQTFTDWEALVVDNHSTDNTDRVVEAFGDSRIRLLKIHNNGVIAASRNLGLTKAKGEYIAFLDSDDWWYSEKLDHSIARLKAGVDIVYHDLYLMTEENDRLWRFQRRAITRKVMSPVFDDLLFNGNALNTSSVVTRRELMLAIGGFSEDSALVAGEDYDAWLRLAKKTERFERIERPLGFYWVGGGNLSSPKFTIATYNRLQIIYREELHRVSKGGMPPQMACKLSQAYYQTGDYDKTINYAKWALGSRLPLLSWLKAGVIMLLCLIKKTNYRYR